jgi:hypothetical protein
VTAFAWIVCGLIAFDALVLAIFFWFMRSRPALDRKGRIVTAAALSGFVFQAFLFFDGPIFYVHLATLAIMYTYLLMPVLFGPAGKPTSVD